MRFTKQSTLVLGTIVMAATGASFLSGNAEGQTTGRPSAPVHITESVPLPIEGSVAVSGEVTVVNEPVVQAVVLGEPTVHLAPPAEPVPVLVVDDGARREQWWADADTEWDSGGGIFFVFANAPDGKLLVVEHVSVTGKIEASSGIKDASIFLGSGSHALVPTTLAEGTDFDGVTYRWFAASQPVRARLTAGQTLSLNVHNTPLAGTASFRVSVSGYLLDVTP